MKINGATAVIKTLEELKVKNIFGYPGGAVLPLYDALLNSHITHILARSEQAACHAAAGISKTSDEIGVCFATSGPGATNLVTGIATAFADSVPLIIITEQVPTFLGGLRDPGDHGHPDPAVGQGSDRHHDGRAADDLLRTPSRVHPDDRDHGSR